MLLPGNHGNYKISAATFHRVFQEELIDTKFAESLVTAFSRNSDTCKNTYIFYGSNGRFICLVLETQAF